MAVDKSNRMADEAPGVEAYVPREYPLHVERTATGETYYSKGWQDRQAFVDGVTAYAYDETGEPTIYGAEDVRYEVWRVLPAVPGECYGVGYWFIPGRLGTPGAFPVTLVYA